MKPTRKHNGLKKGLGLFWVFVIGIISIIATNGDKPDWKAVGMESFSDGAASYVSLFVENDTPYVAYRDEAHGNKLTVKTFNGTQWVNLGSPGFSFGEIVWNTDIYVFQGTPYVAYQDKSTNPSGKAVVMKFNGNTWERVGRPGLALGFSPDAAPELNLHIAPAAPPVPYVAFQDWGHDKKATVMRWNNVNWVYVGGEPAISTGLANSVSLDVYLGSSYVAYADQLTDDNIGKATVRQFDGNAWVDVGNAGFSEAEAPYTTLDLDENRVPYVAYQDRAHANKATVMKYAAGIWQPVGSPGISSGIAGQPVQVVVDGTTPYLAYPDETRGWKVSVKKFSGTSWTDLGSPEAPTNNGDVTYGHSLAVVGGKPYLAFVDVSKGRKVTVLVYE
jgi:hypothetical protein